MHHQTQCSGRKCCPSSIPPFPFLFIIIFHLFLLHLPSITLDVPICFKTFPPPPQTHPLPSLLSSSFFAPCFGLFSFSSSSFSPTSSSFSSIYLPSLNFLPLPLPLSSPFSLLSSSHLTSSNSSFPLFLILLFNYPPFPLLLSIQSHLSV